MGINGARTGQNIMGCFHVNVRFVENKKYFDDFDILANELVRYFGGIICVI